MNTYTIDVADKNTIEIIETSTGVNIVLKSSKANMPISNQTYWHVAFNAIRGFFVWTQTWRDSDLDISLFEAGNCFLDKQEPEEIANEFNMRLKIRV